MVDNPQPESIEQKTSVVGDWIRSYEVDVLNGRELPKLGKVPEDGEPDNRTKDSGMIQFFGELTAFAVGALLKADFKKYAEVRMFNGLIWNQYPNSEDRRKFQLKIKVPTDNEPIRISSIPPQFPLAAWGFLTK